MKDLLVLLAHLLTTIAKLLVKMLGVYPNCQSSWITSVGKPTARDSISYPLQFECEFARDTSRLHLGSV